MLVGASALSQSGIIYEKHTCGFMNKKAFQNLKEEQHNYCRIICDEDYDNSDHLTEQETEVISRQTNITRLQLGPRPLFMN